MLACETMDYEPISVPPTLTAILKGKGDIPLDWVIGGTAVRPRSEEV